MCKGHNANHAQTARLGNKPKGHGIQDDGPRGTSQQAPGTSRQAVGTSRSDATLRPSYPPTHPPTLRQKSANILRDQLYGRQFICCLPTSPPESTPNFVSKAAECQCGGSPSCRRRQGIILLKSKKHQTLQEVIKATIPLPFGVLAAAVAAAVVIIVVVANGLCRCCAWRRSRNPFGPLGQPPAILHHVRG